MGEGTKFRRNIAPTVNNLRRWAKVKQRNAEDVTRRVNSRLEYSWSVLLSAKTRKYAKNGAVIPNIEEDIVFNVLFSEFFRVHRPFFFYGRCAITCKLFFVKVGWRYEYGGVNRLFCIDCQDLIFLDEISLSPVNDGSCVLVAIQFYIDQRVKF